MRNQQEFDHIFKNLKSKKELLSVEEISLITSKPVKQANKLRLYMKITFFALLIPSLLIIFNSLNVKKQNQEKIEQSLLSKKENNNSNVEKLMKFDTFKKKEESNINILSKPTEYKKDKRDSNFDLDIENITKKSGYKKDLNIKDNKSKLEDMIPAVDLSGIVIHILSKMEAESFGLKVVFQDLELLRFEGKFSNSSIIYSSNKYHNGEQSIMAINSSIAISNMHGYQISYGNTVSEMNISHPFLAYKDGTRAFVKGGIPYISESIASKSNYKKDIENWKKSIKSNIYLFTVTPDGSVNQVNKNNPIFWVEASPKMKKFMETVKTKYVFEEFSEKINLSRQIDLETYKEPELLQTPIPDTSSSTYNDKKLNKTNYYIQSLSVNSTREIILKIITPLSKYVNLSIHNSMDSSLVLYDTTMQLNQEGELYIKFPFAGHEKGKGKFYYFLKFENKEILKHFPEWYRNQGDGYYQRSFAPVAIEPFVYEKEFNKGSKPMSDREIKKMIKKLEKEYKKQKF
jgi:hypothetical protein